MSAKYSDVNYWFFEQPLHEVGPYQPISMSAIDTT